MSFTQENPRIPTTLKSITLKLAHVPTEPEPYKAQYHIQLFDQNDLLMKDYIGNLLLHYTIAELQPLRDFIDQLRIDAEAQILGT